MIIRMGKYGKFLACPGYPECKNVKPLIETIDVPCPNCGGKVQIRKTKTRKTYYICENNKNDGESCDYISWNKPKPGEKWEPKDNIPEEVTKTKKSTKTTTKRTASKTKKATTKKTTKKTTTTKKRKTTK